MNSVGQPVMPAPTILRHPYHRHDYVFLSKIVSTIPSMEYVTTTTATVGNNARTALNQQKKKKQQRGLIHRESL